jgi:hypothetical protein
MSLEDEILNYLRRIEQKAASPDFVPHPMLKALMLAMKGAEDGKKDGNYVGLSGDADLTPNKKPHVTISVVVKQEGPMITVLEIRDVSAGKIIPYAMAKQIVIAETLLERFEGQEIPNKAAEKIIIEASALKVHILEDEDEILQALAHAKEEMAEGRVHGLSDSWAQEIPKINTIDEWRTASQQVRAMIGGLWAPKIGCNMVITAVEPTVPKWKLRETILRILEQNPKKP